SFNHQNDRIWAEEAPDNEERAVERTQKTESMMVWASISARGKTPLVFVDQKTKIDRYVYMDLLRKNLFPWAEDVFGDEEWTFQQDDLNPLDYSVWSILEENACQKPHPNVESLKKAWKEITLETLVKIVDNFPKRLKARIDARGGHFE
uniref:Uncharacterized protein n=1 Tax=Acrobeloides nanus TaxID=290746 RepID=A0A914D0X7_9BILA